MTILSPLNKNYDEEDNNSTTDDVDVEKEYQLIPIDSL